MIFIHEELRSMVWFVFLVIILIDQSYIDDKIKNVIQLHKNFAIKKPLFNLMS